jgi:hypothetical protein
LADDLFDLAAHCLKGDAEALEGFRGNAFALMNQAKQDVLGADVTMTEQPRFLLGEDNDPAGPIGKAFEHDSPFQPVAVELELNATGVPDFRSDCVIWREVGGDVPARTGLGLA